MNTLLVLALMLLPFACRSAPASPAPPAAQVAPAAQLAPAHTHSASASGDGYVQLTINGDHGDLLLVMHGDRFTGILDGEVLPAERLVRDGDKLSVKGADGGDLYDIRVLPDAHGMYYPYSGSDARVYAGDLGGNYQVYDATSGDSVFGGGTVWRATENRKLIGVTTSSVGEALHEQLGLQDEAFVLESVTADMPAARAGAKPFDVVTAIDGETGATVEKLREALDAKKAGDTLTLTVLRRGQSQDLALTLEDPRPGSGRAISGLGYAGPNAWTLNANDADSYKAMAEQQEAAEKARTALADQLAEIQAETAKIGAEQSGEAARQLGELAKRQAELAEQMRAQESSVAAGYYSLGLLKPGNGESRVLMLPRGGTMTVGPAGVAAGAGAEASMSADRMAQLEARLAKLEALLERLAPPAAANTDSKSGAGSGSKP